MKVLSSLIVLMFRVFYPFGVSNQQKIDLKLWSDVVKFFVGVGVQRKIG